MNLKDLFGFIYGIFMGTSTVYLKSPRTHFFPKSEKKIDDLVLLHLGGEKNGLSYQQDLAIDFQNPSTQKFFLNSCSEEVQKDLLDDKLVIKPVWNNMGYAFFEKRKLLLMGSLFYQGVHPPLRELAHPSYQEWKSNVYELVESLQPQLIVPAEGSPASSLKEYEQYLKMLSSSEYSFDEIQKTFSHWQEIIGSTSLSENMDYLRR